MQAMQGFGGYGPTVRKASIGVAGVLCLALAGCSAAGSSSTGSKPVVVSSDQAGDGSTAVAYQPLVEPFSLTGPCDENSSTTLGMTNCLLVQVKSIDGQVNSLQRDRFDSAPTAAAKVAFLRDDAAWLAERKSSCAKANQTGGTIDEINTAGCLLKASKARVTALQTAN